MNEETKQMYIEVYGSVEEGQRIIKLQQAQCYLKNTDYIANKIIEYQFLGKELEQDYNEILQKREEAREVIRNNTKN
jgi:hypothetical protein